MQRNEQGKTLAPIGMDFADLLNGDEL